MGQPASLSYLYLSHDPESVEFLGAHHKCPIVAVLATMIVKYNITLTLATIRYGEYHG